jgi:hypothetical protein
MNFAFSIKRQEIMIIFIAFRQVEMQNMKNYQRQKRIRFLSKNKLKHQNQIKLCFFRQKKISYFCIFDICLQFRQNQENFEILLKNQ